MPRRTNPKEIDTLRRRAEKVLHRAGDEAPVAKIGDLASALEELRIHGAKLEIQNEELERGRARAEELQTRYFRHFDLAPVGMVRLDEHGIILEANILGAAMLGVERIQLTTGKVPFAAHVAHRSQGAFHAHVRAALSLWNPLAATRMASCELSLRSRTGVETYVRMQTIVSLGVDDAKDLLLTLTDLSANRQLEEELEQQKEVAEASTVARDVFLAMLSHELRTPLMPALMLIEDLENNSNLAEADHAALAVIHRNLKLEIRLIDDLMDLTRISKGKLALNREITDAHLCVAPSLEISRHEIDEKPLNLTLDLSATQHMVSADCTRVQQIIWNLLRNAVKFTGAGGSITVRSYNKSAGRLTFEITDTGIGIDPSLLEAVFDPFAQADPSLQRRFGGLGLGLAISRSLAEAHDGSLTAFSAGLGKGATFRLELPAIESGSPEAAAVAEKNSRPRRRKGLRILVVEDHYDTRVSLQRMLTARRYRVESANDASSALALCAAKPFDLLLCDIGLPDRSGLELMDEIAARYQIPGIAMTGFGMDSDIAKCKQAGFSEHLTKPVDFETLDAALQRVARGE